MRKLLAILTILVALPMLALEARAPQVVAIPLKLSKPWYGMSSWYGDHWAGRKTACGKPFDPQRLTVAHPYLKCGTWVRVMNVRTGHSAFAQVTDRGPYEEGREMDVSEAVAKRIDLKKYGVETIRIEVVQ